jgi:hypothetical protein
MIGLSAGPAFGSPVELTAENAARLLGVDAAQTNTVATVWNGGRTLFVDFPVQTVDLAERHVFMVRAQGSTLRRHLVTIAGEEGGAPELAAIGFANADRDAAKELIILIKYETI